MTLYDIDLSFTLIRAPGPPYTLDAVCLSA